MTGRGINFKNTGKREFKEVSCRRQASKNKPVSCKPFFAISLFSCNKRAGHRRFRNKLQMR